MDHERTMMTVALGVAALTLGFAAAYEMAWAGVCFADDDRSALVTGVGRNHYATDKEGE